MNSNPKQSYIANGAIASFKSRGTQGFCFNEELIFEKGSPGRHGVSIPELDLPENPELSQLLPENILREEIKDFPEISEVELVRHYSRLAQWNYGVDQGFYPLGSCTMKYNPKINEDAANLAGFSGLHPYAPEELSQGALRIIYELAEFLKQISGLAAVTLQPAAGAHGELVGMLIIRAYLESKGNPRKKVLIPDSAHGTNPASCVLAGYEAVKIPTGANGCLEPATLKEFLNDQVAALMITNPNTLGLFEEHIQTLSEILHENGSLLYCDGANLNALLGICRPADLGIDVLHFNLHKTFSTPHGGGGPGAGPVGVVADLEPFLPIPVIIKDKNDHFKLDYERAQSIGQMRSFYGNFGILVRAYTYIIMLGAKGLSRVTKVAIINANYLRVLLQDYYHLTFRKPCLHECVFSDKIQQKFGVKTLDLVKRLIDYGYHPPTIYFPLIIPGALMIEPTETESKETLDEFAEALIKIAQEAEEKPQDLKTSPRITKIKRLDEVQAARKPILRWKP